MSEFVDYLSEVFQQFGDVRARRMFGGYGVYHNDLMFGLIADDTLYLKADSQSAPLEEARKEKEAERLTPAGARQVARNGVS